jgi:hypothetical protein
MNQIKTSNNTKIIYDLLCIKIKSLYLSIKLNHNEIFERLLNGNFRDETTEPKKELNGSPLTILIKPFALILPFSLLNIYIIAGSIGMFTSKHLSIKSNESEG